MEQTSTDTKAAWAAYQREWRRKNPDKCREIRERYWAKRAAQMTDKPDKERRQSDA